MVVYFYGHTKQYGYFSNFHPSKFLINASSIGQSEEIEVNCAEQAIMWLKALLMGDLICANAIAGETNPTICKKYGRQVKPFDESKWHEYRDAIAFEVLKSKFQDQQLKKWLLETGDEILVEASPKDKIWGIGISVSAAIKGEKWNGQNVLGNTLMRVRKNINIIDK
jgi:ribA/ribD-fused uncharacterized protein